MNKLNLPDFNVQLITEDKKTKILDVFRKKYLVLTPEEWVRQHFLHFLTNNLSYPIGLIAIECGLTLNNLQKRADILVYSKEGEPLLLVECKAPKVKITQNAFDQVSRYNLAFKVPYLIVTNGMQHYCCKINLKEKDYQFLKEIPNFNELV